MDLSSILNDIKSAVALAKTAMEIGADSGPFIKLAYDVGFNGKHLTAEERAEMAAKEQEFRNSIDAVIAADDAATD